MKRRHFFYVIAAALAIALPATVYQREKPIALSAARLLEAAKAGGDYLIRIQQDNGRFQYLYNPVKNTFPKKPYNLLRHAGTAFSLYQLYAATKDPRYVKAANHAMRYLDSYFHELPDGKGLCLREPNGTAKVGGGGLTLLALTYKIELSPESDDKEKAQALARGIMTLQQPSGMFASYHPLRGNEPKGSTSLYYPGEAMLALMRYHALTGDAETLAAVKRGADYLIADQNKMAKLPPDAWFMQALEALYAKAPEPSYLAHALALAEGMMAMQYGKDAPRGYEGGFGPVGLPSSTSASARNEGLLAAYRMAVAANDPRAASIGASIRASLRFQLAHQYAPGRKNSRKLISPGYAAGSVRDSAESPTIRIDYVQHHISSLLGAYAAFGDKI